ncbi:MAG TPA: DUF2207 domain-containing protein [Thermopetrobacter sp.]|nr:DUF2207 domain-containing protein [Thermopetrobacter sp.]
MSTAMRALLTAIALLLAAALPAWAAEEILDFDVTVEVRPDAALIVTERITVRAEGRQIKRGIYRDFPLTFRRADGTTGRVGFEVLRVLRDGKPENWFVKNLSRFRRIYFGRKTVFLKPGVHTYALTYRTTRQIRYFKDYDELYWNVTGNFWAFPILKARVTVKLPNQAPIRQAAVYTGRHGEAGQQARITTRQPGLFVAETTAPLPPRHGFTIAIAFPKGVVAAPPWWQRLLDRLGLWWLFGGVGLLGAYFLWAWNKVGRDPAPGAIYPRWEPPAGLSPAGVAWLTGQNTVMGGDKYRQLSAAILSLAVKGLIRIDKSDGDHTRLVRLKKVDAARLPPVERAIMVELEDDPSITLSKSDGKRLKEMMDDLATVQKWEYEDYLVKKNRAWFWVGVALAVAVVAGFFLFSGGMMSEKLLLVPFAGLFLFMATIIGWKIRQTRGTGRIILIGFLLLWGGPFVLGFASKLLSMFDARFIPIMMALLAVPALVMLFRYLLPRPTEKGRQLLDEVEGLKMFIETAEKHRLEKTAGPEMSVSLFEKLLPYAVALGLEKNWTKAFQAWLAAAAAAGVAASYNPHWYTGRSFSADDITDLGSSLVQGISSDMAAAMPAPVSSSGSSGGGFSGGGGGGGGGGGW